MEYQNSFPTKKGSPVELYYTFGLGVANLDTVGNIVNGNFGGGIDYFFTRNRFQHYIGLNFNNVANIQSGTGFKFSRNYFNMTPSYGFRCYLTNRFALNAGLGYQLGWGNEKMNISGMKDKTKKFYSGPTISLGISFVLRKKDIHE